MSVLRLLPADQLESTSRGSLFAAIGIDAMSGSAVRQFAAESGVPIEALRYYDTNHKLPIGAHLTAVCSTAGITELALQLRLGVLDRATLELLRTHADEIAALLPSERVENLADRPEVAHETQLGTLYRGDCLDLLRKVDDESVDLVFADPPFNLNKLYPSQINDDLRERTYLAWCESWLGECLRVLRPGGSLFAWNLPRWNAVLADFLSARATFRHWITCDIKFSLPIGGRLYPSHYSLLYYCKGNKPRVFHPDRMPMEICPHCLGDLRDYGGYKDKMNSLGVNLTDVWFDIPPVRHSKHKKRDGANELSLRLLDRVIEMSSNEGDVVLDPFGGSGTTYAVAEIKNRRWIGIELGPVDGIIARLSDLSGERERIELLRASYNNLFTKENRIERERLGLWTDRTVRSSNGGHDTRDHADVLAQEELPL